MSQILGAIAAGVIALAAGLYFYGRHVVAGIEAASPPLGTFVTVENTTLHVVDRGQGPPIVLIHGASGNLRDFTTSIFDELVKTHRVIAIDRPGLGWSDAHAGADWCGPDCQARLIHDALTALGVQKPVVLGHSWGGAVAMAYGLEYPDEVKGVLDLSGATHPWTTGVSWYNAACGLPILGPIFVNFLVVPLGAVLVEPGIIGTFRPNAVTPDYRARAGVDLLFRANNFANNAQGSRNLSAFNAKQAERYPDFKPPLIILTGADDPVVPSWNHAQRLKKQLPSAELIEIPGVGHMPHHVAPDQVIAALERLSGSAP
jgi:pimeloyl-ACP methyl ester carboxylesterase